MKRNSRARLFLRTIVSAAALALTCVAQPPPPGEESTPGPVATPGGDPIDFNKLLPILPNAPEGWKAEDAEGSTEEMGDTQISTAHRDYAKEGADAPTTSISILDSVASPDYVEMTTAGWKNSETTAEGYSKPVTIDGTAGFETFENEGKHGALWLLIAKRYFLQIEITGQDAKELQEWLKRIDLKKLAAIK